MVEKVTKVMLGFGILKRFYLITYLRVMSPLSLTIMMVALTPKLSHILFSETEIVSVNSFLLQIQHEVGFFLFSFYFVL